jgi:hypothetical protein
MTEQQAVDMMTAFVAANPNAPGVDIAREAVARIGRSVADRKAAAKQAVKDIG